MDRRIVLIVLPPSEGKAIDGDGPPLDLTALSFPGLNPTRRRVLDALTAVCTRADAAQVLELPAGQAEAAIARNRAMREAPTLPAGRRYTGVLYDNLDLPGLDQERAADQIVIFSGAWGAVRITDPIPPYRLAMAVSLPPLGRLSTVWRAGLTEALRPLRRPGGLVVDMRSAPYAAAWRSGGVTVRVFRERRVDGVPKRTVVSHMAKATRGRIAHDLLAAGVDPATPEELHKVVTHLGHTAELNGTDLDVILHD